jgi:hypothetical protein
MILQERLMTGRRLALTLGLFTLMATAGYAGQEELMKSVGDALAEGNATRAQLAMTLGSLNALLATDPGGDLRPAYQAYIDHAEKTKKDAELTRQRVAEMNSDSTKYFGAWRTDNQKIANQKLRKVATKRLEQVKKDYQKSLESLDAASGKFVPFLTDLSDIQTALSNDLTAKGLKAAKDVFKKANRDHNEVQKEIDLAVQHLMTTQATLSPTAGTK